MEMIDVHSRLFVLFPLAVVYLAWLVPPTQADGTVSIFSQPAYSSVRPCVQNCIWCGEYWLVNCPGGAVGLNNALSCNNLDSCFCRADLQASASSYLTTCIYSQCKTNAVDVSDGVSLYNGYCGIGGATLINYPATSAPAIETTTSVDYPTTSAASPSTTTLEATPGSTPTVIVYSTVTSGSSTFKTVASEWPLTMTVALAFAVASVVTFIG